MKSGLVKGDAGRTRAVSGSLGCLRAESFPRRDLRRLVIQSRRLFATVQSILSSRRPPILRESLLFAPYDTLLSTSRTRLSQLATDYARISRSGRSFILLSSFQTICFFFSATKYKFVRSVFLPSFSLSLLT